MGVRIEGLNYNDDIEILLCDYNCIVVMDSNAKIHYGSYDKIIKRNGKIFILEKGDTVGVELSGEIAYMFNDGEDKCGHFFDNISERSINIDNLIRFKDVKTKSLPFSIAVHSPILC